MKRLRIFVADDHDDMRDAICEIISAESDMSVVGRAGSVSETLDLVMELKPDLIVTDVWMPGGGGVAVCESVRSIDPVPLIVAVSASSFVSTETIMLKAGAKAFLLKDAIATGLPEIIRRVALSSDADVADAPTSGDLHSLPAIAVSDRYGNVCGWDGVSEQIFGWSATEVLGRSIFEVLLGSLSLKSYTEIHERHSSGDPWEGDVPVTAKDGTVLQAHFTKIPIMFHAVVQCVINVVEFLD